MTDIETVYRLYFQDVFLYVCKLCGDRDTAEEITAETFFRAIGALDGFRGDCDIRVWLCRIAKNIFYSIKKAEKRRAGLIGESVADTSPGADELLEEKGDARSIRRLVHGLDEPYKEVFMLRCYQELDFRSIGELFGRSANWACVVYHRARKRIAEQLRQQEEGGRDR